MIKRNNQKKNRFNRPAWVDMFAKTRVAAKTSDGRDWHTDIPNVKLSRAFVVVLILHVVAVGGILAFEMFKPKDSAADIAQMEEGEPTPQPEPAPAVETARPTPPPAVLREQRNEGYERYIVQANDQISSIADRFQISRAALLAANRIDEMHPLVKGRILRVPRSLIPPSFRSDTVAVSAADPVADRHPATTDDLPSAAGHVPAPPADLEPSAADGLASDTLAPFAPERPAPAVANDGFRPLSEMPGGDENARPRIVAPRAEAVTPPTSSRPRVVRGLPAGTAPTPAPAATSGSVTHKIAPGDNLYQISRKHGVSVDALLAANPGADPRSLRIGQEIRIP